MYKCTVYPKQYLEIGIYYSIIFCLIMLSYMILDRIDISIWITSLDY